MNFSREQYNYNSMYILNNGYYIDFKDENSKKIAVVKSPEGADFIVGNPSSSPAKTLIDEALISLFKVLEDPNVEIIKISPKTPPFTPLTGNSIKIIGKISTPSGSPIENVMIKPVLYEKPQTAGTSNVTNILPVKPVKTNELGEFIIEYNGERGIFFNTSYIKISKVNYFSKSIGPTLVKTGIETKTNPKEESIYVNVYDLGKIVLQPTVLDLKKEEMFLRNISLNIDNKILKDKTKKNLKFEEKQVQRFLKKKEEIRDTFIFATLETIGMFGPNVVHIIAQGKNPSSEDKVCPPKEQLVKALKKRNRTVLELNNTYKVVRRISKLLKITDALLFGIRLGLTTGQIYFSIPTPLGGKALYTPLIELTFQLTRRFVKRTEASVDLLQVAAAQVGALLGFLIGLLNNLDILIQDCAKESVKGQFVVSFEELNKEFANLIDENKNSPLDIVDPITGKFYPYKGFTFEIKDDISQNFQYPKRYAIARNIQGIQVLRSESSFASGPEILIEELKFIIDRDNLRAD